VRAPADASGLVRSLREEGGQDLLDASALALGATGTLATMLGKRLDLVENMAAVTTAIFVCGHSVLLSPPGPPGYRGPILGIDEVMEVVSRRPSRE